MKSILFAADHVYLGGGEIALLDLISALGEKGFRTVLVIPEDGPIANEARARHADVRVIGMPLVGKGLIRYPVRFLRAVLKLMAIIKRERISYIFANSLNAGIYASLAAKPSGARILWYCWGYYFPMNMFWQYAYRFLFDKIVFCSFFIKGRMRITTFKQNEMPVLYPGIDINRLDGDSACLEKSFKQENKIAGDCSIFSIIGRLDRCKNHLMFLDVADEIARRRPKSYFVIAGGSDESEGGDKRVKSDLEEKIKGMPSLAGKIIFTGFVKDAKRIIKASKVVFSCTGDSEFGESFGLSIVESMVSGKAIIAVSIGGPKEIITDGVNGFLVRPGDYKSMARKAIELIDSKSKYDAITENAGRYALEKYQVKRFAEELIEIYEYQSGK